VYLLHRVTADTPPGGWPVYFVCAIFTIVWLQWFAAVQGAVNELWLGPVAEDEVALIEPIRLDQSVPTAAVGGSIEV
jgi:hypothetical protein